MSHRFVGRVWLSAHPATQAGLDMLLLELISLHCRDWAPRPTPLLLLSSTVEHQLSSLAPSQLAKHTRPCHAPKWCSHPFSHPLLSQKTAVYIWEVFLPRAECLCTRNYFACVKKPALLFQDKRNKHQTHLQKVFVICIKFIAQTT